MLKYFDPWLQEVFQRNLSDWCVGGPNPGGWTREGPLVLLDLTCELTGYRFGTVQVQDALAKNQLETQKWHLDFLQNHSVPEETRYFKEYLVPRYSPQEQKERMESFLDLYESMKLGFDDHKPVMVADVSGLNLGFRWFRFDGCHRLCCAAALGMEKIPAWLFTTRVY